MKSKNIKKNDYYGWCLGYVPYADFWVESNRWRFGKIQWKFLFLIKSDVRFWPYTLWGVQKSMNRTDIDHVIIRDGEIIWRSANNFQDSNKILDRFNMEYGKYAN